LIFSSSGAPVLIMTSGAHRVDTDHVADQLGIDSLDRADKDLVREATGQVIGGVAPCGHPEPIPTYVDVELGDLPVLWAASGPPESEPGQPGRSSDSAPSPTATRLAAFASSRGRYYAVFLAVFCAVLIISNISATKVIGFGPIVTDGGAFLFPIAYILGDVISEV